MARMRLSYTVSGVRLFYTDPDDGKKHVRDFYTGRSDGGYVYETGGKQVCDQLYSTGHTLSCGAGDDALMKLIRREWFKRTAENRRDARKDR